MSRADARRQGARLGARARRLYASASSLGLDRPTSFSSRRRSTSACSASTATTTGLAHSPQSRARRCVLARRHLVVRADRLVPLPARASAVRDDGAHRPSCRAQMLVDKVHGSAPGLATSFTPLASSLDLDPADLVLVPQTLNVRLLGVHRYHHRARPLAPITSNKVRPRPSPPRRARRGSSRPSACCHMLGGEGEAHSPYLARRCSSTRCAARRSSSPPVRLGVIAPPRPADLVLARRPRARPPRPVSPPRYGGGRHPELAPVDEQVRPRTAALDERAEGSHLVSLACLPAKDGRSSSAPVCRYRSTSGASQPSSSSPVRSSPHRSTSVADFAHGPRPRPRSLTLDLRPHDRRRPDDRPRARASEQQGASSLRNSRRSRATGSPHRLARLVVAGGRLILPLVLLHTGLGVELHTPRRSGRARRLCRHPCLGPSRLWTSTRRAFLHLLPTPPRLAHARASMSPRGTRSNSKSGRCVRRPAPTSSSAPRVASSLCLLVGVRYGMTVVTGLHVARRYSSTRCSARRPSSPSSRSAPRRSSSADRPRPRSPASRAPDTPCIAAATWRRSSSLSSAPVDGQVRPRPAALDERAEGSYLASLCGRQASDGRSPASPCSQITIDKRRTSVLELVAGALGASSLDLGRRPRARASS